MVVSMSFALAGEAQAGKKGKGGSHHHHKHHYQVHFYKSYYHVKHCHRYHYGFCSYYKRYGSCNYYVPGPVGGPPVLGTIPAPAPGSPVVVQSSSVVSAAVVQPVPQVVATALPDGMVIVKAQTTAQAAQTDTADGTTTASPSIDTAQLTAIVAAVQSALEQPKQAEQAKIDPAILKALEQLIDQKMAEATETETAEATETEAAPLPETEQAESESNDSTLESLRAMIAQLLAQE